MMQVYKSIAAVQGELAREGIAKDRNNQQQGYKFRGIDDVYNALAPYLSKHGLCILPRCLNRDITERVNAKGTALFYVVVAMEFDFVSSEDGSKHTVGPMYGEAMDSGDKATNKAMSAAFKYACMQAFSIPTEGDNDSENQTHEVQPRQGKATPAPASQGGSQAKQSATQTKYFPLVREYLGTLFGDDVAAKKKECHSIAGVDDYRTLDGKKLEDLAAKLKLTVDEFTKKDMPL